MDGMVDRIGPSVGESRPPQRAQRGPVLGCNHTGTAVAFVRHPEMMKNLLQGFGGGSYDNEETDRGRDEADSIIGIMSDAVAELPSCCGTSVWSSGAPRAARLASNLAKELRAELISDARLGPINNGPLSGMTAAQVAQENPDYFRSVQLHRRGVLSGYQLKHPGQSTADFERQVSQALRDVGASHYSLSIILSHKSTIGAAVIYYARKFHGYPSNFYGYIDVPTATVSLVSPKRRRIIYVGSKFRSSDFGPLFS